MENQQKTYTWPEDSAFILTGTEYGLLYRFVHGLISNPEFQQSNAKVATIMDIVALTQICQKLLTKAVEEGIASSVEN